MVGRENHIDLRVQVVHLYTSLKILKMCHLWKVLVWKICKMNYKLVHLGEKIGTKTQIPKKAQNLRHLLMEYNKELNKGE